MSLLATGVESEARAGGGEEQSSDRGSADVGHRTPAAAAAVAVQERHVFYTQHPQSR